MKIWFSEDKEASTVQGLTLIAVGIIVALVWWFLW